MRKSRFFLLLSILCIAIAVTFFLFERKAKSNEEQTELNVVNEVQNLIERESVYDVTTDKLVEGALRGMANAINDPYSTYYSQQEAALHKQTLAGERIGIGVELSEMDGKFIVIAPVKASPADKAGIRPLDEVVQINETRLEGKSMGDVMKLMQGKEGETVTLVIFRPDLERHVKIVVKRERLKNETVQAEVVEVENTKIGHITITLFGEETALEWKRAVVIGVTSFGKGTVQQSWELQNGGELKLSTNKWLTPSKRWIHHVGIEPDVEVIQHPLYQVETKLLKGRFDAGDYGEEVAYSQLVLSELGYGISRTDGFFDMDTAQEVAKFRKEYDLQEGRHIDEAFFNELTAQLQKFKASTVNDMQFQMAISFSMHQLQ